MNGSKDGAGQRRHRHRESDAEQEHTGQQVEPEVHAPAHHQEPEETARCNHGADRHEQTRPEAPGQAAEESGQPEHAERRRDEDEACRRRRESDHLLQVEGDDERAEGQGTVHERRRDVAHPEIVDAEKPQGQHRPLDAGLGEEERREGHEAQDERKEDARASPAVHALLDEGVHRAGQAHGAEHGTEDVDPATGAAIRLAQSEHQDQRDGDGDHVDDEHPPPPECVHENAT